MANNHFHVFHATAKDAWKKIKEDGYLRPHTPVSPYYRDSLVYLAYDPARALEHGDVLLSIKFSDLKDVSYLGASEWQIGTPHPIPVKFIRKVK